MFKFLKKLFKPEHAAGFDVQEVATFVHQFRAPLTAVKWVFESLQNSKIGGDDQGMVKTGLQTTEHMSQMVDDVLNLAQLESGGFDYHFEKVNLVTYLEITINDSLPVAKAYGVELLFDHPEEIEINVNADPLKLGLVATNLMDNAIKYNRAGGSVTVKVEKTEGKEEVRVSVKDTGIGIPPEAVNNLFKKFFRADNAKQSKVKGTGFGLYIVKEIVEKLGGKIWVESALNKGTTFYFTLPTVK